MRYENRREILDQLMAAYLRSRNAELNLQEVPGHPNRMAAAARIRSAHDQATECCDILTAIMTLVEGGDA